MSAPQWHSAVVPARLAFLAIYNPSLGLTDDTFQDQLVFYYSRAAHDGRNTAKRSARKEAAGGDALRAEENEKLRHIGLAQGMVDFARSFSDGQAVDWVDTEKSRIVLHELENGWWILASIDLTRLPTVSQSSSESPKKGIEKDSKPTIEYSSREVSPPALLLSQIIQAHFVFTLHHGPSLSELFVKLNRERFCGVLDRFWTRFARSWDVLLHGNPAADIFPGIKLSSGGELGMGVGEEEWGSGERDVLEDLTRRTEGLVDLIVSRFGEPTSPSDEVYPNGDAAVPWLGSGKYPSASDGVIFGGINAISRTSLRNVSLWMKHIYTYGDYAYGVRDNPHREKRKRRRRNLESIAPISERSVDLAQDAVQHGGADGTSDVVRNMTETKIDSGMNGDDASLSKPSDSPQKEIDSITDDPAGAHHPEIPPPIVSTAQKSLDTAALKADSTAGDNVDASTDDSGTTLGIPDQYMKYLTFGLSTLAKPSTQKRPELANRKSSSSPQAVDGRQSQKASSAGEEEHSAELQDDGQEFSHMEPMADGQAIRDKISAQRMQEGQGQFVIGFKGDLGKISEDFDAGNAGVDGEDDGPRNVLRTVQIEIIPSPTSKEDLTELQLKLKDAGLPHEKNDPLKYRRLRTLIYIRRPFMYCFLFEDRTPALGIASFYKSLHQAIEPIHKPLLASTSASRIAQRIEDSQAEASAASSEVASTTGGAKSQQSTNSKPIFDLIWDPALLTVHTSIPNIPEPGTPAAEGIFAYGKDVQTSKDQILNRVDALNVHSQILSTYASTERSSHEYERTSKTSRGWWVVWMKLSASKTRNTASGEDTEGVQSSAKKTDHEGARVEEETFTAPLEPTKSDDTLRPSADYSVQPSSASQSNRWLDSTIASKKVHRPTNRIAFLVRKATDSTPPPKSDVTSRAVTSMWQSLSLRSSSTTNESTGGSQAGWGPAALAGGIGIDARKYVDDLLQLNR